MIAGFSEFKDTKKVGNKAASLIEMKNAGFNVPDGFVADSDFFTEVLASNGQSENFAKLLASLSKENVKEVSIKAREMMGKLTFEDASMEYLAKNIKSDKLYAVRSSGSKEDLADSSFAGQYETFLNVPKEDVAKRILSCYQSMFSEHILSYLVDRNIDVSDMKMSVVIQEMVPSQVSGICFTVNPVTGVDKEMLIELAEGLGENLVGGKAAPVSIGYNWMDKKFVSGIEQTLVSSEMLDEMADTFMKVMLLFGFPCDIEFAVYEGRLYLLQARMITRIKYQAYADLWTTADFKDGGVSASVCTPYMWSLYEYIWEYTLPKFILDSKILKPADLEKKMGDMFFGRCYWNLSVVKKTMSKIVGYKEREFDSEYGIRADYEGDGQVTGINPKSLTDIARIALAQKKILKTRNENAQNLKDALLKTYYERKEAYDSKSIDDIKTAFYKVTHDEYLFSESTYFWQIFINTIHQSLYKDGLLKYVSESEYLTMLGCIDNISHLLPFYDMWDVSREIRKNEAIKAYWESTDTKKLVSDFASGKTAENFPGMKEVIDTYGYHSDKELDVTYPCYYEDPSPLFEAVKASVLLDDSFGPEKDKIIGTNNYKAIMAKIKEQSSSSTYKKVDDKVVKMRKMLWWREEFRDLSTRFYYIIRVYTMELADQLVKEGVLKDAQDVWFLRVGDLWDYLDGKKTANELQILIDRNRMYYNAYRNYISDNEIGSVMGEGKVDNGRKGDLSGLGANNGVVTAVARVIESFDEIDRLEPGDILVTRFTDTGWTSKFAILSGIVTEYGGILCHAAIVSREYGIPAIVNCTGAMDRIHDGDKITIDGTTGKIIIESK